MINDSDMYEFLMELGLTKAILPCRICAVYIETRQNVLVPELLNMAEKQELPPIDVLVDFRNRYHKRHMEGK